MACFPASALDFNKLEIKIITSNVMQIQQACCTDKKFSVIMQTNNQSYRICRNEPLAVTLLDRGGDSSYFKLFVNLSWKQILIPTNGRGKISCHNRIIGIYEIEPKLLKLRVQDRTILNLDSDKLITSIQCESKKIPPCGFWHFSQTDGNFLINFYTPIVRSFLH